MLPDIFILVNKDFQYLLVAVAENSTAPHDRGGKGRMSRGNVLRDISYTLCGGSVERAKLTQITDLS